MSLSGGVSSKESKKTVTTPKETSKLTDFLPKNLKNSILASTKVFIISTFMLFGPSFYAQAALNVPSGSSFSVSTGTIVVTGGVNNNGTLTVTTGSINVLSGDWGNGGVFTPGTGSVQFSGSSAQTLNSGGTGVGKFFNDLTYSGSNTLQFSTNIVDINGNLLISSGTVDANGQNMTIAGNWTNSGTFTPGGNTVTFDGTGTSTVTGNTTFYNLASTTAGKTILFADGSTQTVLNTLTWQGSSGAGNLITLDVAGGGTDWNINVPGGPQVVQYINVSNSNALNNVIYCVLCTDGGNNNANWIFQNLVVTIPANGSVTDTTPTAIGVANAGDTVVIKDSGNNVVATTVADANGNWRVETSALSVGANSLTAYVGIVTSPTSYITVQNSPATSDVPVITSPADNERLNGANPTITGLGAPGQTVTIVANNAAGTFLLQTVGTGVIDANGNFSVTLTTAIPKGTVYLSATVNGVASHIVRSLFVDPFGVVFDSGTNEPIKDAIVSIYRAVDNQLAVVGTDLDPSDVNPLTTGADGFYSFLTASADYYIVIQAPAYTYPSLKTSFPSGRVIVTGSKGETFTIGSTIIEMDQPVDSSGNALRIVKDANKSEVRVGDVVTYTVTIESLTDLNLTGIQLKDTTPAGFKYLGDRVTLDGVKLAEPTGQRPLYFDIGNMSGRQKHTLKYQLVVGSGVTQGDYDNVAIAQYSNGFKLSNTSTETVRVVLDPLFDLSNVLGKVFFDNNHNGVQDGPGPYIVDGVVREELPVAKVKIVMEDGTTVIADNNGKFSVPNIKPGRHVFRLDESTLPEGTYLTTDKAVIIDITPGLPVKVNFGVAYINPKHQEGQVSAFEKNIRLTQSSSKPAPRLNAALFGGSVKIYNGGLVEPAEFRVFTNYSAFIDEWTLEISDADTGKLIRKFTGTRADIYAPIDWDGKDEAGDLIRTDRHYQFDLKVKDSRGNADETTVQPLALEMFDSLDALNKYQQGLKENREDNYAKWVHEQMKVDHKHIQNIPIDGETVTLEPIKDGVRSVQVYQGGNLVTEMGMEARQDISAHDLLEGANINRKEEPMQVILPKGDYEIKVKGGSAQQPSGELVSTEKTGEVSAPPTEGPAGNKSGSLENQEYSRQISVGADHLLFVAMGDAKAGYTMTSGHIEPVATDDKFRGGFWHEGRMAYYLKGKVKGKYLVTSSFDSDRQKKELFKKLDTEQYYPVYGDSSELNQDATNTQGNLYVMIQWDKSSAQWGNYAVGFNDTELAQFNRSLYGGKIDYTSLSTTKFGVPRSKAVVFKAKAQQKAAHNEFLATGGSLYYLKNRDVIEGSEKIRVEIRDKVTGLVLSQKDMLHGTDYEIDYKDGRIVFWRPVQSLVESQSIISNELLNGNYVYVVSDYEYEVIDKVDESSAGARVKQAIGDYVEVGGTYVKDNQEKGDYKLKATDATVHLGQNTKVTAEYAESEAQAEGTFMSTDGGITFTDLSTDSNNIGRAYSIGGDTRIFNRLGLQTYYKSIDSGFSTGSTTSQQGKELTGFAATYDMTDHTRITAKRDIQTLLNDGNAQTKAQVGAEKTVTSLMQVVHEFNRLRLTGEYRKQQVTNGKEEYTATSNGEENTIAVKAEYDINSWLTASIERQVALQGAGVTQTTVGMTARPSDKLTLKAAETVGSEGSGTAVGAIYNVNDKIGLTADYALLAKLEGIGNTASVGAIAHISEDTDFNSSVGVKSMPGSEPDSATVTLGGKTKVDAKTDANADLALSQTSSSGTNTAMTLGTTRQLSQQVALTSKRTLSEDRDSKANTSTYELTRDNNGKKLTGSYSQSTAQETAGVSRTNIFGLSGDVNDRWALSGSYERGLVQNLNATESHRNALTFGAAYVKKDEWTGVPLLSSSSKLELRLDDGNENTQQYLISNATQGQWTQDLTLFSKLQFSKTRNTTLDRTAADYKEIMLGSAYRPVTFDRLNLISRYTYLQNLSPLSQTDKSSIEDARAHVFSAEGIYDLTMKWQLAEKLAYRIADEKVTGFDMNRTHTWLTAHRLNYKLDDLWTIGGEFRMLTQQEAKDSKKGFLIEGSRKMGEFAQLGVGYNFTSFDDDLTKLNYNAQGPFIRLTGTLYDQTPEEVERMKKRQLEQKLAIWSVILAEEEIKVKDSDKLRELNEKFDKAQLALKAGDSDRAIYLFESIISESDAVFGEAANYIRGRVEKEYALQRMKEEADRLYSIGRYDEAKEILEKILEEAK